MKQLIFLSLFSLVIFSCSSKPILPDIEKVKVSREKPSDKCRELGVVYGKTLNSTGINLEKEALQDLIHNAAIKGANYVYLGEYGAFGGSVKGTAYDCP
jgi:hypothetical protein